MSKLKLRAYLERTTCKTLLNQHTDVGFCLYSLIDESKVLENANKTIAVW